MKVLTILIPPLALLLAGANQPARASGGGTMPTDPTYVRECGECHAAYPVRPLSSESWRALLAGLNRHFGQDASLDPETLKTIDQYLTSQARRRPTLGADGAPLLRITETPWFRHEHDEIPAQIWRQAAVQSPARCEACHAGAARGQFSEHDIHFPEGVHP